MYQQTEYAVQEALDLSPPSGVEVHEPIPDPVEYWELQDFSDLFPSDALV